MMLPDGFVETDISAVIDCLGCHDNCLEMEYLLFFYYFGTSCMIS